MWNWARERKRYDMADEGVKELELLAVFHYVMGSIIALLSCIPFLHVFMGLLMLSGTFFTDGNDSPPPTFLGWMFIIPASIFILMGWGIAICILVTGRKLTRQRHHTFCMVIAAVECMFMPFGTVLGVFTLISLNKDPIKKLFLQKQTPEPI